MGWSILGSLWPWKAEEKTELKPMTEAQRERFMKRWKTFQQENKCLPPDYSKFQGGDLNEDPLYDHKENPTPQELEENKNVWNKVANNKIMKFLAMSDEYAERELEEELEENELPFWPEDHKMWKALPNVPQPYNGRPMPKHAIKDVDEAKEKFWDFMKQYLFGLWGYRQRPYHPGRPVDVTQAIGTEYLSARYYDFAMKYGNWYYKDRLGRTRGPMELINLRTALASGIVDKDTFVWGDDMDEWTPIGMVYGLEAAVNTTDVKLAAAGAALGHKLARGLPLWIPAKGRERKTYKQLQKEGIESKEREKAVIRQHGGVVPGQIIPSHTLFLWASGTELTPLIERDTMPNKYVSYNIRCWYAFHADYWIPYISGKIMAKVVPGLRPWEVLNMEQIMDSITYAGWHREPLGSYTTGPHFAHRQRNQKINHITYQFPMDKFTDDLYWLMDNAEYNVKLLKSIFGNEYDNLKKYSDRAARHRVEKQELEYKEARRLLMLKLLETY